MQLELPQPTFSAGLNLNSRGLFCLNPNGSQCWIFIGRADAEAETPIIWPPDVKNWLIGKDPDAGKDWRQEERRTAEDEMVGWYHWLNGHEFEQTLGDSEGKGSLVCCSPWGHRVGHEQTREQQWLTYIYLNFAWLTGISHFRVPCCSISVSNSLCFVPFPS